MTIIIERGKGNRFILRTARDCDDNEKKEIGRSIKNKIRWLRKKRKL
ncbi:MAG: hypothetical protein ACOC5L_04500 [Halobacteriota archaeon]